MDGRDMGEAIGRAALGCGCMVFAAGVALGALVAVFVVLLAR